jgi:3-hydroxyacyl-CoA dehydrogenase/enoyl-CoA hydratase/3-hydroxybutyryl-CoA epimerase
MSAPNLPLIQRQTDADGVCVLTFDRPGSSANIFDRPALDELDRHLAAIAVDTKIRGLIVESAKKSIFIAGADLRSLMSTAAEGKLDDFIAYGQQVFAKLAALNIPTVAVIHGAAAGGGYEFTLACDYRIASSDRVTKIGLPETQIGLLPAWGGASRLPRLLGLTKASAIIVGGRLYAADEALKLGIVDEIATSENLREIALKKIEAGKPQRLVPERETGANGQPPKVRRDHYPAAYKALEVMKAGISMTMGESLKLEREAIVELAATETTRNLVRIFFLTERARKLRLSNAPPCPESKIIRAMVIGAGLMGSGIAQWLSMRGISVTLSDLNENILVHAQVNIKKVYETSVEKKVISDKFADEGLARISYYSGDIRAAGFDLIIEAALEKMDVKKSIFHQIDSGSDPNAILATNTSALSISDIATASSAPSRVIGLHFFNPVSRMKLVEVVEGEQSDPVTVQRAVRFVQEIGKLPVVVKDRPGFLVNRVLFPYLLESVQLFEKGVPAKVIEEAMLDFGMPMGPLRLMDEIGTDICNDIASTLVKNSKGTISIPEMFFGMIRDGLLGRKNGRGFYIHNNGEVETNDSLKKFVKGNENKSLSLAEVQKRLSCLLINESVRCLEEKVVATPEDADFGLLMGIGFPSFRGGPIRYAEHMGLKKLVTEMERLSKSDNKFEPCALLRETAARDVKFYEKSI